MVRTRADSSARKAVAAKAPRKQVGSSSAGSSGSCSGARKSGNSGGGGGNPLRFCDVPSWQKGIAEFYPKMNRKLGAVGTPNGSCSTTKPDEIEMAVEEKPSSSKLGLNEEIGERGMLNGTDNGSDCQGSVACERKDMDVDELMEINISKNDIVDEGQGPSGTSLSRDNPLTNDPNVTSECGTSWSEPGPSGARSSRNDPSKNESSMTPECGTSSSEPGSSGTSPTLDDPLKNFPNVTSECETSVNEPGPPEARSSCNDPSKNESSMTSECGTSFSEPGPSGTSSSRSDPLKNGPSGTSLNEPEPSGTSSSRNDPPKSESDSGTSCSKSRNNRPSDPQPCGSGILSSNGNAGNVIIHKESTLHPLSKSDTIGIPDSGKSNSEPCDDGTSPLSETDECII